jgi:SAM-dependent methyltransferase
VTPQAFACRACGETAVDPVLSLGELPLVNELVDRDADKVDRFPLDVVRCTRCTLVQITETVPPERLFRTYSYFSSFSDTYVAHMRALADWAVADLGLGPKSLVVEAASNDGCLLRELRGRGIAVLGIEPARNVAEAARAAGIETLSEFLDVELARSIVAERGNASLVVANNVLAHVPDANGFVAALALLAGSAGHVVIEVPYLRDLVDAVEFDTIYHEHLSYFSLTSLQLLLARHGLVVRRVERIQVHGGSLRIHAAAFGDAEDSAAELLAEEAAWGVDDSRRFARFATDVEALRRDVYALVTGVVGSGATVAAYGAAAKGVVLANACGLDASLIRFVVDRNPHKQGRLLPGVGIPVRAPEALLAERPDYCVLFAWNLADEIAEQQAAYVEAGGSFIKPIPTPRVLAA